MRIHIKQSHRGKERVTITRHLRIVEAPPDLPPVVYFVKPVFNGLGEMVSIGNWQQFGVGRKCWVR